MRFYIHPELRYVLTRAALDALPATLVACGLIYGLIATHATNSSYTLFFGFGVAVMLLVAVARFASHLWWLARASQVLDSRTPVRMYLTADQGWKQVELHAADPQTATPAITGARFITLGSGVATLPQQGKLVDVYLDNAYPDLLVMRLGGKLLCTEVKQRFEQGHGGPVRETTPVVAVENDANPAAPSPIAALENTNIQQDIAALAQGVQMNMPLIMVIGVVMIAFCLGITGAWRLITDGRYILEQAPMHLFGMLFALVFCGAVVYIIRTISQQPKRIQRGAWVVQQTPPVQRRLTVRSVTTSNDGTSTTTWYIDLCDTADSATACGTIKLLTGMTEERAAATNGTTGLVYALANKSEPVVIQTTNGVVVGETEA